MAFFISPGVQVREFDISTIVTQYANSAGAYVGAFEWGPVEDITTISSKARLQKYFGNPTDENALHWFSCSNFLEYANNLKVVRVVNDDVARNATVAGHAAEKALADLKKTANLEGLNKRLSDLSNNLPRLRNENQLQENIKILAVQVKTAAELETPVLESEKNTIQDKLTALQNGIAADPTATPPVEGSAGLGSYDTSMDETGVNATTASKIQLNGKDVQLQAMKIVDTPAPGEGKYQNIYKTATGDGFVTMSSGEPLPLMLRKKANDYEIADFTKILQYQKDIRANKEAQLKNLNPTDPNYETDSAALISEINDVDNEISGIESQIQETNKEIIELAKEINTRRDEISAQDRLFNAAKTLYDENVATIANATAQENAATQRLLELATLIAKNEQDQQTVQNQIEAADRAIKEAEGNLKESACFIKNQSNWTELYSMGSMGKYGEFAAKYPSVLGSNIAIYMADANTYSGVSGVTTNVDSYIYESGDDGLAVTFTLPPTGPNDIATGHIELDLENPDQRTGKYKIKRIVVDNPGKNYRFAPDVTLPNPLAQGDSNEGVPKAYAALWRFANQFLNPPNTSNYVKQRGGENDELHIVVVDETGVMTGTKGQVMERFANVSKAEDARFDDNTSAYYVAVLRDQSQYVYWMDHPEGMNNWGAEARNTSFKMLETAYEGRLGGGVTGSEREHIGNAELIRGWDCFADPERVDIGILITGPADRVLQQYVINIAERRMDCVAVISPEMDCVVKNPGNELNAMLSWRDVLNASSYGFADCNWKYQYDQYNDTYRWLPCNPDIAGLMARTDEDHDPWWSPAGFNRGHIKNVVKLAWNPDKTDRDEMYGVSINPVCLFLNEGTILYGDKTMLLKTSAFSRINVRRLFIVLEKSISTAAKYMLFEFNDVFTRLRFRQMVDPFLRDVKGRRGMYDYKIVCDETNNTPQVIDSNAFVGDIYIKPSRSINFIQLNFVAVATGVAFEEVIGSFGDF